MYRLLVGAVCGLVTVAGLAGAFEVEATIKKVDQDKGVLYFHAKGQDRTAKVGNDLKVLDAKGNPLSEGLKTKELKPGAVVTLSIERVDDRPVIRAIRLGNAVAVKAPPKEETKVDTSKLVPLTDLGTKAYQGFPGGLYPNGQNTRPAPHEAAGLARAKQIQPLDAEGKPNPNGKIVLLAIGFSNTVQGFNGFQQVAREDKALNPQVVLVNGAVGGMSAAKIHNPNDNGPGAKYWATVDERLKASGVTRQQVQVIWLKETNPAPHPDGFPKEVQLLQTQLGHIVRILSKRFPNAPLVYLSSRTYGGWAKCRPNGTPPGNSEPYSYESGFAYQWLIEQQLKGDPELNFDAAKGPVKAPWLSWGPYLWANGSTKRSDGFSFALEDFREDDRMHHSAAGQLKIGRQLLQFFKTDSTTRGWFVRAPR